MTERGDSGQSILFYDTMKLGYLSDETDPTISTLFSDIIDAELALHTATTVDEELRDTVCDSLNEQLAELDLIDEPVYVSGIVRPEGCSMFCNGIPEDVDGKIAGELAGFGQVAYDDFGPYYIVHRKKFYGGAIFLVGEDDYDGDTDEEGDTGTIQSEQRELGPIAIGLNITDDGDPRHGDFYILPSEVSEFYPQEATEQKIVRIIRDRYPLIAEVLDTLPLSPGNDKKIIEALRKLDLVIDWADYPGLSQEDAERLFDYIGKYILDRVGFDSEPYTVRLQSELFLLDTEGMPHRQEIAGTRNLTCRITGIKLRAAEDQTDTPATGARFVPTLKCLISSSTRRGGHYEAIIPLTSIRWAHTTRNPEFFEPMFLLQANPNQVDDDDVVDSIDYIPFEEGIEQATDLDEEAAPAFTVDILGDMNEKERNLASLKIRYEELFDQVRQFTGKSYKQKAKALEAAEKTGEVIRAFMSLYPFDTRVVVDVEGPGVHALPAVYNPEKSNFDNETSTLHLTFDHVQIEESSIVKPHQGVLMEMFDIKMQEDQGSYQIEAWVYMSDAGYSEPYTVQHPLYEVPLFQLLPVRRLAVQIDREQTHLDLPGHARIKNFREAVEYIRDHVSDLEELPAQLASLYDTFDTAQEKEFEKFPDTELLNSIGQAVGGDELATDLAVDALTYVLNGRQLSVTGPAYTADGTYIPDRTVTGIVRDVVATTLAIPVGEPIIVLRSKKDKEDLYIPLSTIQEMEY